MRTTPNKALDAAAVAVLHTVVAIYLWAGRGVTIVHDYGPDPWSWFWQNIGSDLLRDRALESLWWLHAQPPLWNALGAVLIRLFGDAHMPALQGLNILFGAGLTALTVLLVERLTARRSWALAAGLAMALHPSLFLYEAYALYTVLVAFLILLGAYLLSAGTLTASWRPLVAFVAVLSALILTRSLYHLVLLAGAVPLVLLIGGRPPRSVAIVLTLLVLAPTAWYGKNVVQHGFFGASSWYGMGLWRSALFLQDTDLLDEAFGDGSLETVTQVAPFSPTSVYWNLGYQRGTSIPLLGRDDLHNVNVPAISAAYQRSARHLIRRAPARYAANVIMGYGNFCAPSSEFRHLDPNRERMGALGKLDRWVLLRPAFSAIETRTEGGFYGSLLYFLFPAVLLTYLFQLTRGLRRRGILSRIKEDAVPLYLAGITLYTIVVGCTMELGENVRFKFPIEAVFLVLAVVVVHRLVRAPNGSPQQDDADPTT